MGCGRYRSAGEEVIRVLCEWSDCVERASVDEAYIDLTTMVEERLGPVWDPQTISSSLHIHSLTNNFVVGFESSEDWLKDLGTSDLSPIQDTKLAIGAEIVGRMREAVFQKTGFRCSAGIAHNKVGQGQGGCGWE